jgi:hypothetical protein
MRKLQTVIGSQHCCISTRPRALAIRIGAPPRTDPTGQLIYWKQQM